MLHIYGGKGAKHRLLNAICTLMMMVVVVAAVVVLLHFWM
jgi:hypothetical protein